MSINIFKGEYPEDDYIFCDLCRTGNCSYKFFKFPQYVGWYCRCCWDEVDNKIILDMGQLKTMITYSTPTIGKTFYRLKQVCQEIKKIS